MASEYTPNYNLDLYVGTDKPNLRDQYNSAMGKVDTQMKANADGVTNANANVITLQSQMGTVQSDVSTLKTNVSTLQTNVSTLQTDVSAIESTVETHGTQITDVQKTADDALSLAQTNEKDIADTQADVTSLSDRVTTAEGEIDTLQSDVLGKAPTNHASSATTYGTGNATRYGHVKVVDSGVASSSTATAASPLMVYNRFSSLLTFTVAHRLDTSWADMTIAVNAERTLYKVYGFVKLRNTTLNLTQIPGSTDNLYGYKLATDFKFATSDSAYTVVAGGYSGWDAYQQFPTGNSTSRFSIGTDGQLYICQSTLDSISVTGDSIYISYFPSALYINANFGDKPDPVTAG